MIDIEIDGHDRQAFEREMFEWSRAQRIAGETQVGYPTPQERPGGRYLVQGVPEAFLAVLSAKGIDFKLV